MDMRGFTLVVAEGIALLAASIALGALRGDRTTAAASPTFTATPVGTRMRTTCSNSEGTHQVTNGNYTGIATGDAALAGPIRLTVHAAINKTKRLGTIDGSVVFDRPG